MGSEESKPTRNLTIINEDSDGTIRVTEAAARKLDASLAQSEEGERSRGTMNDPYSVPMESLTLRKRHAEEMHALQESFKKQVKEYEDQNKYLWFSTTKKLSQDLTNIEEKYTRRLKYNTVCPEVESQVESCYSHNKRQPLKCSRAVKDFVACVTDKRFKALTNL
jgi:hypothetical protein